VKPANIVGAIANEAGLDGEFIGRIDINDEFSTVDLPEKMPQNILRALKKVWVAGQQLKISRKTGSGKEQLPQKRGKSKKKGAKKQSAEKR
jgi:ATP-dependent RNA helicase DeaD